MRSTLAILVAVGFAATLEAANAATTQISSPNGSLTLTLSDEGDAPNYHITLNGAPVIEASKLGLVTLERGELGAHYKLSAHTRSSQNTRWEQPWGERRWVADHHNELLATFAHVNGGKFNLRIRAFDDGIGFRYEVPAQEKSTRTNITDELTEFALANAANTRALWIPGRGWNRYEYPYRNTPLADMGLAHTPATFKNGNGVHISIHEAALVDYAAMVLDQRRPGILKANLTPWSDGIKVKTGASFVTPWRTLQISESATGLLNSDLILNLNEPNALGDVSWVKPGKYVGIWWGMHLGVNTWGSGPKHGATTKNTTAMMDFAAEHGFDGVLVEGWNEGWDGDWFNNGDLFSFTKTYADFDLAAVTAHAKAKGVRLIGHHETSGNVTNYRNQMAGALDLYAKVGVTQIKTGYVADGGNIKRIDERGLVRKEWHDGQFMVNEYLHNIRAAAQRKISINTHEPIKDTGLRRTYPNWISREGARGQEFNAWGSPPNAPDHTVNLAFTRMLAGPMDFTPGIFNLAWDGLDAENRVQTTLAKQLALYVVLYSPIQMAADLPENYLARPKAFQFIKDVVTDWEQSHAIAGELGDYAAFARKDRHSSTWFIGAITDEQARTVTLPLHYLKPNTNYRAEIYRDGEQAHWKTAPYDLLIETRRVTHADQLTYPLAASGGLAVRLVEENQ
ncbi:glycoside hydrolase family 97 protein [Simiduia aestuariiviva]|uniref:Alpha-glucosidase n=1 Tax=Simiduia aestuariiviva TaxID=1510459 RepID=A0A839UT46_9GAMM|nr:glycoside hydrolase family 97 protein [Simiduia aestuariiviva]MBB3169630.1 alpha-glucosidase [Simiduia aestuariiviva]